MGHSLARMFGGGGGGQTAPPTVAPTIDNSQAQIQAAQDAQLKRSNAGRASTILTGGEGITTNAPTSSATLLGMS